MHLFFFLVYMTFIVITIVLSITILLYVRGKKEYNSSIIMPMVAVNFITKGHSGSSYLLLPHFNHVSVMVCYLNCEIFSPFSAFKTQLEFYLLYEAFPHYSFP